MLFKGRSERGASAITIAISMLVLLGMAAIALDLSAGWNERRQDQTASDISAVAGALSFGDNDDIADEVMSVASSNLGNPIPLADWIACIDPERPLGFTPIDHSVHGVLDCISVNPSFIRVRLPDQSTVTTFGRLLGIDTLTTSADTIVTLFPEGGAGALPFGVQNDASSGEICLDTSTGGKIVDPCGTNEQGSFGNIAPPLFGNTLVPTTPACSGQTAAGGYIAESIAMGIDHILWTMTTTDWNAGMLDPTDANDAKENQVDPFSNMDRCIDTGGDVAEAADGTPINAVLIDTGNSVKGAITEGLMTGTNFQDGDDARLTRTTATSPPRRSVDGVGLDNDPLWDHLTDFGGSGPIAECDRSTYGALSFDEKNARMTQCLVNWTSVAGRIFEDSIIRSPRLALAPRLWFEVYPNGIGASPIRKFDVVYIHALHFDDKDETAFYPGEGTLPITLNNMKEVEQVTAFLLEDEMVSQNVHEELGGFTNDTWVPEIYE